MNGASSREEFGKDLGVVHEAIITGRKVGANRNFWLALAHDEEKFREVVKFVNVRLTFDITVDYNRSLVEMVKTGRYDWVNHNITAEHFPVKDEGNQELTITLFHFNRSIASGEVFSEMEKQDFRPAKIEELLALGEKYPELQKKFHIVALGSVWRNPNGYRRVPVLSWDGVKRSLGLSWLGRDWSASWRFAALRK